MMFEGIRGELKRRELIRDYPSFVEFVNEDFCMTKFHKYVTSEVQEFLTVKTGKAFDILLLSVPPRHGKSHMVTETLPVWFLGNNPKAEVILCSYQSTFAEGFSKICRDKFNKFAPTIFKAGPDASLQRTELWATEAGGRCRAAGLDAGITGFGAELFIIDDPIKNAAEASSEVIIKKILAEMGPSVQSRIYPGGKLIVIQTRWVENDVIGFIKDNWAEFIWKDINLPCEYDEEAAKEGPCPLGRSIGDSLMGPHLGDPVLPQKIANDNNWLRSKKMVVMAAEGARVWNSLYQGRPTGAAGNLFDAEWFGRFKKSDFVFEREKSSLSLAELKERKQPEYLQLSVDATFKGGTENDFVAMGLRGIYRGGVYLFHQVNKRMTFVQTVEKIKWFCRNYPEIDELVLEDKANGPAIADVLRYETDVPPVVCVNPMGGKVSRAEAITPFVRSGNYYIAEDLDEEDVDWHVSTSLSAREKIIVQHKSFPFGKHDDMVDENSQGTIRLIKLITGEEPKQERRFIRYTKWYPDMWEDFEQMSSIEQEKFVQTYGAPLEWMPEYSDESSRIWSKEMYNNYH
jgi:predicted phage terminase large subunit-like protein